MRKLIQSVLGTTAAVALVVCGAACSRSRDANTSSGVQSSTPAAERVNPGSGYYGAAPENVNRPTTAPTAVGGGPAGVESPSGLGTSGTGSEGMDSTGAGSTGTDTDMTGTDQSGTTDAAGGGSTGTKKKTKKPTSTNGGSTDPTGGGDKGSGTTGGTQQK